MVYVWASLLALAAVVAMYGCRPVLRWRFRHIPGPKPAWLFGSLIEMTQLGLHEAFRRWSKQYGSVYKVFEGGVPTVVVEDPELGRWVNARMPNRSKIPSMETGEEERFLSAGILFARDNYHRGVRAAWQPMFHSASLEGFVGVMNAGVDRALRQLGECADAGRFADMFQVIESLTLAVSSTTAFGIDLQAPAGAGGEGPRLLAASRDFLAAAGDLENVYALLQLLFPAMTPAVRVLANWLPTPSYRRGLAGRRLMRATMTKLLQQHRAGTAATAAACKPAKENGGPPSAVVSSAAVGGEPKRAGVAPGSFLDLMSRAVNKLTGLPFTDDEVVCQAFSFVLSAQTTSPALTFAVYLLACNPDKEAKLLAELDAFGRDKVPTLGDLSTLVYAEAVLKESLRLYPAVPITIREADKDLQLGRYAVPRGTNLVVSIYGLHRNAKHWRDPEAFQPERFLAGAPEASLCDMEAYMPFGEGIRACIGQRYAWQQSALTLVRFYQRFTFRLAPGQVPLALRMSLSMSPRDGVMVTPHQRGA